MCCEVLQPACPKSPKLHVLSYRVRLPHRITTTDSFQSPQLVVDEHYDVTAVVGSDSMHNRFKTSASSSQFLVLAFDTVGTNQSLQQEYSLLFKSHRRSRSAVFSPSNVHSTFLLLLFFVLRTEASHGNHVLDNEKDKWLPEREQARAHIQEKNKERLTPSAQRKLIFCMGGGTFEKSPASLHSRVLPTP